MKKSLARHALHVANVPRHICDHLIGKDHSTHHRMGAGLVVMGIGVSIAKIHSSFEIVRFLCDMSGYLVHGLGCTPFIDSLVVYINGEKVDHDKKNLDKDL